MWYYVNWCSITAFQRSLLPPLSGSKNRTSWTTHTALHNWHTLCTTHRIMCHTESLYPPELGACFLPLIPIYLTSHKSLKVPTSSFKADLATSENISQQNKTPVLKQLVISLPIFSSSCRAWGLFPWTLSFSVPHKIQSHGFKYGDLWGHI